MYVARALEHERPFFAPLYKFMVMHPRGSVRKVPPYVSFFLRYLSRQVRQSRHYPCAEELRPAAQAPRVDAQASDERTGRGRWLPFVRDDGTLDKWQSRWFSAEIRKEDWPWIFERDGRPALVISTPEALAVLVGLKLFYGNEPQPHQTQVKVVPTWTDNRGNGSLLNKLMTTRFPSSAVVMELAAFMKKRRLKATVQFAPRETNREADALANGVTTGFNPKLECVLDLATVAWTILPEALQMGREAERAFFKISSQADTTRAEALGGRRYAQRNGFVSRIRGSVTCGKRVRRTRFVCAPPRTTARVTARFLRWYPFTRSSSPVDVFFCPCDSREVRSREGTPYLDGSGHQPKRTKQIETRVEAVCGRCIERRLGGPWQ